MSDPSSILTAILDGREVPRCPACGHPHYRPGGVDAPALCDGCAHIFIHELNGACRDLTRDEKRMIQQHPNHKFGKRKQERYIRRRWGWEADR